MSFFEGKKGERLFTRPFESMEHGINNNTKIVPLTGKIEQTQGDRARMILVALEIEYLTDEILQIFIPGYKKLNNNKDFSFSMKQSLLTALELIPKHIISCGSIIREIRNEFAHNLELERIYDLDQKFSTRYTLLFRI